MPGFPLFAVQMRTEVLADLKGGTQAQHDARSGEIRVERVIVDADVVALDEFVDDSPASHQVMQRVRINCRPPTAATKPAAVIHQGSIAIDAWPSEPHTTRAALTSQLLTAQPYRRGRRKVTQQCG